MPTLTDREFADHFRLRHRAGVPADERAERQQQLFAHVHDPAAVSEVQRNLGFDGGREAMTTLADVAKAITRTQSAGLDRQATSGQMTLRDDPLLRWTEVPGTVPRAGRVPPQVLRDMAQQDPIIQSILQVMKNRAVRHTKFVASGVQAMLEGAEGFDVVPTFQDPSIPLTAAQMREKMEIVSFIQNSGNAARFTADGVPNREDEGREGFSQLMAHIVNQRFILDAVAIEIQRSLNRKKLTGLYVADGATIARVDKRLWPYGEVPEAALDPGAAFVQVWRNQIVAVIGSNDLLYDYANPRDTIGMRGYGISETEMSMRLTTGILNILTSNNAIFDRGSVPPGILYLLGNMNSNDLTAFQQEWDAYRLGAGGSHQLPALNIRDPQGKIGFLKTNSEITEMQFDKYANFISALRCACFGVDVTEINMSAFGGNNASLNSGKDSQTKIDETKNRAFIPFMMRAQQNLNDIIGPFYGNRWQVSFVGLQKQDTKEMREMFAKVATVDEMRQVIFKMPAIGGIVGSSIANSPALAQMAIAAIKDGAVDSDGDGKLSAKEVVEGSAKKEAAKGAT